MTSFAGTAAITELWAKVKALVATKSTVSASAQLAAGTQIGSVTVDGSTTNLYIPSEQGGGVVLWESASGTTSTITMADSAANYDYIDVYYLDDTSGRGNFFERLHDPEGRAATLFRIGYASSNYPLRCSYTSITFSGTQVTFSAERLWDVGDTSASTASTRHIKVYRIVGYQNETTGEVITGEYAAGDGIQIAGDTISTSAADYVVEENHTSTGGYRKWNSGRMEAWTKRTVSTTVSTSWGNLYRSSSSYDGGSWPETFQTLNHCWTYITADGGDMAWCASVSSATTSKGDNVYILRGSTLTSSKSFVINWYGVGTWK